MYKIVHSNCATQIVPLKNLEQNALILLTGRLLGEHPDTDLHVRPPVSTREQNSIYVDI